MTYNRRPLKEGEGGPYVELAARPPPDGLVLQFIPSLVALLHRAEEMVGAPLTEAQVTRIRDAAMAVVTRPDVAAAVAEQRGYADVNSARPWESWQAIRSADLGR